MTRKVYKMRGERKYTYYVYNAENGEFLGCGSRFSIKKYFGVGEKHIESCAKSNEPLVSSKNNIILNISKVEGVIEDIPFTIELAKRGIPLRGKRKEEVFKNAPRKENIAKCNFVEVFKIFRYPRNEEEKKYMRTHFSIINLEKVRFELDTRPFTDGFPFRINFVGKGRLRSIIFSEKFYSRKLAEERFEYLKNFQAKQCCGDFWYNKVKYDVSRVVCVERTRNGKNKIMSPSCDTTKKTNYKEYLDLAQFLQSEFIR
jgi:hypothetical protein|nr:MAG TPA: hypothetical protein [Caudoviricetes sp.]